MAHRKLSIASLHHLPLQMKSRAMSVSLLPPCCDVAASSSNGAALSGEWLPQCCRLLAALHLRMS